MQKKPTTPGESCQLPLFSAPRRLAALSRLTNVRSRTKDEPEFIKIPVRYRASGPEAARSVALGRGETPGTAQPPTAPSSASANDARGRAKHPGQLRDWLDDLRASHATTSDFLFGLVAGELEALVMREERRRAMAWVSGVPTKTGFDRALRIASCGKLRVSHNTKSGEWSWAPLGCKDAACPYCQDRKSKRYAWALAKMFDRAGDDGEPLVELENCRMVTLTQRREPGESIEDAYARLVGAWDRFRCDRMWRAVVRGGMRTFETVYRRHGEVVGEHMVKGSGYHVHIHALIEIEPEAAMAWAVAESSAMRSHQKMRMYGIGRILEDLMHRWCRICPSAKVEANRRGWENKPIESTGKAVRYVTKYVTKAFDLPPYIAREFFSTMVGRRWVEGWGSWRDWRKPLRESGNEDGWVLTDVGVPELFEAANLGRILEIRWRQVGDRVMSEAFGRHQGGLLHTKRVSAHSVVLELMLDARSVRERRRNEPRRKCDGASERMRELAASERGPP